MGGDCTWTGCVPSKSLLASARVANTVRNADKMGVMVAKNEDGIPSVVVDFAAVMRRVKQNIQTIYEEEDSPEVMKKLGIDFIQGRAFFDETDTKAKTLIIDNSPDQSRKTVLRANKGILLATGAKPVEPKIEGLETVDHVTYEGIFDLIVSLLCFSNLFNFFYFFCSKNATFDMKNIHYFKSCTLCIV